MNNTQKKILIFSAAFIVVLTIFPPFIYKLRPGMIENAGYSLFFLPPKGDYYIKPVINVSVLLIEYLAVVIVGCLLTFAFKEKKDK